MSEIVPAQELGPRLFVRVQAREEIRENHVGEAPEHVSAREAYSRGADAELAAFEAVVHVLARVQQMGERDPVESAHFRGVEPERGIALHVKNEGAEEKGEKGSGPPRLNVMQSEHRMAGSELKPDFLTYFAEDGGDIRFITRVVPPSREADLSRPGILRMFRAPNEAELGAAWPGAHEQGHAGEIREFF